jgi:putative peptidoglycan lipid II flippase
MASKMIFSSAIVTLLSLIGSFIGFLIQLLLAKSYGLGVELVTYLYAISAPSFLAGLIGAMLSYMLVPIVAGAAPEKRSQIVMSFLVATLLFGFFVQLLSPLLMAVQESFLPEDSQIGLQPNFLLLLKLGWLASCFQLIQACSSSLLLGLKRPIIATVLNLGPYLGMLFSLTLMGDSGDISSLAYGLVFGSGASVILALFFLWPYISYDSNLVSWEVIRPMIFSSPYVVIAMSCFSVYAVIDSYWAPRAGEGALAALGYSQRILIAVGNLVVSGPSAVIVPRFTEILQQGNRSRLISYLRYSFSFAGIIIVSLALTLFIWSKDVIHLLFMRGAFSDVDVIYVSEVMRHTIPGMIFMLLSVLGLRIYFCFQGSSKMAALLGLGWCLTYFIASSFFIEDGASGIASAYSIAWVIYASGLFLVIHRTIKKHFYL